MRISDWSSDVCSSDLKSVAAVVTRSQQIAVPCGASQIFGKIAAIRRPARMPVQKIVHLCPPLARDDRADSIEKFAAGHNQIGDRKSTRLNSSHSCAPRMPASACKKKQIHN